jgi:uncharacterized caspase-like protein
MTAMWWFVRAVLALIVLATVAGPASAAERFALLIGNEACSPAIRALANPQKDVVLLEPALKSLGFKVTTVHDAGIATLIQAINAYARRVHEAGPNAVGFFYYSGHGAQNAGYVIRSITGHSVRGV